MHWWVIIYFMSSWGSTPRAWCLITFLKIMWKKQNRPFIALWHVRDTEVVCHKKSPFHCLIQLVFACMNSMKSRSVSSWLGRVLKRTTLASIRMTARRRVGGHSAHCGRKSQSLGIRVEIVLRMRASFCCVHCQICGPSPHSMRRCCCVSCMPKLLHLSVGDNSIPDL